MRVGKVEIRSSEFFFLSDNLLHWCYWLVQRDEPLKWGKIFFLCFSFLRKRSVVPRSPPHPSARVYCVYRRRDKGWGSLSLPTSHFHEEKVGVPVVHQQLNSADRDGITTINSWGKKKKKGLLSWFAAAWCTEEHLPWLWSLDYLLISPSVAIMGSDLCCLCAVSIWLFSHFWSIFIFSLVDVLFIFNHEKGFSYAS